MGRIDYRTANNSGRCRIFRRGEKKAREPWVRTNKRLDAVEYLDQSMDRSGHNENVQEVRLVDSYRTETWNPSISGATSIQVIRWINNRSSINQTVRVFRSVRALDRRRVTFRRTLLERHMTDYDQSLPAKWHERHPHTCQSTSRSLGGH